MAQNVAKAARMAVHTEAGRCYRRNDQGHLRLEKNCFEGEQHVRN